MKRLHEHLDTARRADLARDPVEHSPQESIHQELARLRELEHRVKARCAQAVPQWAPELRELLR